MAKHRKRYKSDPSAQRVMEMLRKRQKEARRARAAAEKPARPESEPTSSVDLVPPPVESVVQARFGPVRVGDLVLVHIDFTADPGPTDSALAGKERPCVVGAISGTTLVVHPVHGADSKVGRDWPGRRITGWWAAGLEKESVVARRRLEVGPDQVLGRVGVLGEADRKRFCR